MFEEEQLGSEFWAEPIAPLSSDPLYLLMAAEEGEIEEVDPEDVTLRAQYRARASRDRIDDYLQLHQAKVMDKVVSKSVAMLKRSRKSFEEKIEVLCAMGVDQDDAVDMLIQ